MKKITLKASSLKEHLLKDWRRVHGIWENVKNHISMIVFNTSLTDISSGMTESTSYADLDLSSYVSAIAKGVIVSVRLKRGCATGNDVWLQVSLRKNGSSVDHHARLSQTVRNDSGGSVNFYSQAQLFCPCDTSGVIEWKVVNVNCLIDYFAVVGYWE